MKLVVLYHPESEFARSVEVYANDFQHQHGKQIELISLETKAGSDMAKLYDIMHYPAIIAVRDNGELLKDWQDNQLPLMNEVAAYIAQ